MNPIAGTSVLVFAILLCAGTAVAAFVQPAPFAEYLGLTVANPGGANEIRSQYAGFFLMVGLVCGAALLGAIPRPAAYLVTLTVFGGLFFGRVVSLVLNQGFAGYPPVVRWLVLVDFIGTALSLAALAGREG